MSKHNGKVYKYDLHGNFIAEYENAEAAAFLDNIASSYLLEHLKGTWSYCHKHVYTKKYYIKLPPELLEHKTKRIYNPKEIYQYSLDGKYINSFKDKNEAAEFTGLKARYIRDCASGNLGKGKTYGGFLWSFEKKKQIPKFEKIMNYKEIHQYSLDGKYIKTYNSIKEAKLEVGSCAITHCAQGSKGNPTAGGFIWSYEKVKSVKPVLPKKRPINVYKNNKLYKTFESQAEVSIQLKLSRTIIWKHLKNNEPYNDFVFKYK
jgi:hypothetical protein